MYIVKYCIYCIVLYIYSTGMNLCYLLAERCPRPCQNNRRKFNCCREGAGFSQILSAVIYDPLCFCTHTYTYGANKTKDWLVTKSPSSCLPSVSERMILFSLTCTTITTTNTILRYLPRTLLCTCMYSSVRKLDTRQH